MARIPLCCVLSTLVAVAALWDRCSAVALPPAALLTGPIKDVRGIDGMPTLTVGTGKQAKDRLFNIHGARIVGPSTMEWKVGDLHEGDIVEMVMAPGGEKFRRYAC